MDPIEISVAVAILAGSVGGVATGLVFAWAALKKWTRPQPEDRSHDIEDLRSGMRRLADDVTELQERLDFAERVLASQRGAPQIPDRH